MTLSEQRRANGFKVAAMRRARTIAITCRRCGEEFTTPATRHNAWYCEPCREIVTRETRRTWKHENRERHLANRRRQERTPNGRAAKRRRAIGRYARMIASGKIIAKRRAEHVCSCGAPFIGQARQCSECRRRLANLQSLAYYYDDLDRNRAECRARSARNWAALSPEERSDRAWRKWIRRRYGVPTAQMLELLAGLRMIRKDLEGAGLYPRAEASRRNGRKGGGRRKAEAGGGSRT